MAKRYKKESVLIIDRGLIMSKQLKDYQFSVINKHTDSLQNNFIIVNVPKK